MKNFLHLAIALMSVVMPALAVKFNCSGFMIDKAVVEGEMNKRIRQGNLSRSTLGGESTTFYNYFDITTSGLTSSCYYFRLSLLYWHRFALTRCAGMGRK
ncbi:CSEP0285 putative effector protein [Blumeria hordei DH14]|uniref:CSEP0285 putative effector protein n=1 Tax=Blumeria graminis f. sp. hordei (strain DH14) TaxID=546991 RepID=N1J4U5_BLUG1|nr:CSEP0285 putative effector protein [Blumeria hordei DH14]